MAETAGVAANVVLSVPGAASCAGKAPSCVLSPVGVVASLTGTGAVAAVKVESARLRPAEGWRRLDFLARALAMEL